MNYLSRSILFLFLFLISCGEDKKNENFQRLVGQLRKLDVGYTYDLVKENEENCYLTNLTSDTLFYNFNKFQIPILGILPSNGTIFSIIHLEPGEDLHPTIRTFDKQGKMIDEMFFDYSYCVDMNCNYLDCSEKMEIVDNVTIKETLKILIVPCDSFGRKLTDLSNVVIKTETRVKLLTIEPTGKINIRETIN